MNLARNLVDLSLNNKGIILCVWMIALALAAWGTTKLTVSSDNRVFYSSKNSAFEKLQNLEEKYLPNHNISFLISNTGNTEGELFELVEAVRWLSEAAWAIENVIRVDSIHNYPVASDSSEDSFTLSTLAEVACFDRKSCENAERLETPPIGIDLRLISKNRRAFAVSLSLELNRNDTEQIPRIISDVAEVRGKFQEKFPKIKLHHTGGIPMMFAFSQAADQDTNTLAPLTILLILCISALLLGSFLAASMLMVAGVSSAILTLGIAGHLGHVINPATSIASIMILTLVVTSGMHYLSSYLNDSRLYDTYRSTVNATSVNIRPIALATITSIAGFASLTLADAPPVGQLGLMASAGVLLGALHIFLLGPIFLKYLPLNDKPNISQRASLLFSRAELSRTQALIAIGTLVLVAAGTLNLKINDDFVGYFDQSFEFRTNTDFISKKLSGPNHLEIDVISPNEDSVFTVEYLREIDQLAGFLREDAGTANVFSVVDIFREIEPLFEISQFQATPEELAQFYLAFELSLKEGQSTTDYISSDQGSTRISIILGESDSTSIRQLIEKIENFASEHLISRIVVTGENAPVAYLTPTNFKSMSVGIAATMIIAALVITTTLGSFKLALMSVACTAAPIIIGFGIWGWTIEEIGLASVVVLAITIGIVIDDAIHIVSRYQEIRKSGAEYSTAIEQTIRIAGGAIIASSIALACGFGVLAFSGFGVNASMGLCTAIIVLSAMCVDLLILPWALKSIPR